MKSIYSALFIAMALGMSPIMQAQEISQTPIVGEASLTKDGALITADINFDFSDLKVKTNQASVFEPMIVNGSDTVVLPGVGVYGRTRWYQFDRAKKRPLSGPEETVLRYHKDMPSMEYSQSVEYQDWMNGAELVMRHSDYGCTGCGEGAVVTEPIAQYNEINYEFEPVFQFQEAVAEVIKARELSGRAYVDFPVNKIVIYPDYRSNYKELGKIIATIDSVKNDPDITVTSIHIAGTASPEGSYDNNVYLAKNRTKALKEYVQNLYQFPEGFITTSYEPVDWTGLREWLESNNIENREGILSIVNSDIEPYARNSKIKTTYPAQYQWLLTNVYPALRHSDYRIEYSIRQFTDVAEIAEVFRVAPLKLSLSEMYAYAGSLEPGSDNYNEVFETAVRLYPNDESANLNAANVAMEKGNIDAAARYLEKAGDSAQAVYARGVLSALQGDYAKAESLVEKAIEMGMPDNNGVLDNIRKMNK